MAQPSVRGSEPPTPERLLPIVPSRLLLGPVDELQVSLAVVPYMTVLGVAMEAVGAFRRGLDPRIREAVSLSISHVANRAFDLHSGVDWPANWPDFSMPLTFSHGTVSLRTVLDEIRDMPAPLIAEQIHTTFSGDIPPQWLPGVHHPDRFQSQFIELVVETSVALSHLWTQIRPLIDGEQRRVDLALRTGTIGALLQSLTPKLRFVDESLVLPEHWGVGDVDLAGRRLVLIPTIGGPAALASNVDSHEDIVWFCYPVPIRNLSGLGPEYVDDPPLEALLGRPRATVMRYLYRPTTMAEIANLLHATPAAATFHVNQLESAGLVVKERRGREIRIRRTETGNELFRLLDRARPPQ